MEIRVIVLFILVTQFCIVHSTVDKPHSEDHGLIYLTLDVASSEEEVGIMGGMHERSIRENRKKMRQLQK